MLFPFPEYRPDVSDYMAKYTGTLANVLPRADGYGPFPDFSSASIAINGGNDSFTKILLNMEGSDAATTFTDTNAGGSAHTWTAAGNANTDNAQEKFGLTSLACDGTGDWISTGDHADFNLSTSNFVIDCWFNCTATSGSIEEIAGQGADLTTASTLSFNLIRNASDQIQASVSNGSTLTTLTSTTTFTDATNTGWHHVAVVRSSTTLYLFIDGALEDSDTLSGTVPNVTDSFFVGKGSTGSSAGWTGWIDEFRLSVGTDRGWTDDFLVPEAAYDTSANSVCRGAFLARNSDGSVVVFAGTIDRLYRLNNTTFQWIEVSKDLGAYTDLTSSAQWQFVQFGSVVIAVQTNVPPQAYTLGSSSQFADLGGSPPQASYVSVVNRFLVLSGLNSNPFRVHWSGYNAITTWTQGVSQSDFQDLPDGGIVRKVEGGETGIISQDGSLRRMTYAPGSPTIFQIERIASDLGIFAPLSMVSAQGKVFLLTSQGFYSVGGFGAPVPIGRERVDRTVLADYDSGSPQLMLGVADPKHSRVFWAYKSLTGTSGLFNKMIGYDFVLDRWIPPISITGEYITSISQPGVTLENLDSVSPSIDALSQSLDSFAASQTPELAAFNSDHKLGFFRGSNLEATLTTSEQDSGDQRRIMIKALRPHGDSPTVHGSISARETRQASAVLSTESSVNSNGECPQRVTTRYARAKARIPAGTSWTHMTGMEADFSILGRR